MSVGDPSHFSSDVITQVDAMHRVNRVLEGVSGVPPSGKRYYDPLDIRS